MDDMDEKRRAETAPVKPSIPIGILQSTDIRVGTILTAEDVPGSRKLVRLTVEFEDRQRRILSGMRGEREDIAEIVGKQALFVVNLEPRTMAGEVSEGMLFDIGFEDGLVPALAVSERPMPNGSRAG